MVGNFIFVRPELLPNRGLDDRSLVLPGVLRAEKLVNMSKHQYRLEPNVSFKCLSVVVVDEQHKFGVEQRSQIRTKPAGSGGSAPHILVMTATPIPRTLYLALTGARDMSTIQTPPQERQPVETIVLEYHDDIVREVFGEDLPEDEVAAHGAAKEAIYREILGQARKLGDYLVGGAAQVCGSQSLATTRKIFSVIRAGNVQNHFQKVSLRVH